MRGDAVIPNWARTLENVATEATFSGGDGFPRAQPRRGPETAFTENEDFLAFERVVEETLPTRRMRLCSYCLMPNHWHFVVWPERDGDLPAFMQQVTNTHVKRWKEHRHEIGYGHLYQGRYKCFPVEREDYFSRSFATWSGTPCVPTSWSER